MLADEPFSDEPRCVCPVIAEFLRTYNDQVDDARRQDLYAYASLVVGTRDDPASERGRANLCLDWWLAASAPRRTQLRRLLWMLPPSSATRDIEIAHRAASWAASSPARHADALRLIETMAGRKPIRIDAAEPVVANVAVADARVAGAPVAGAPVADAPVAAAPFPAA